MSFDIEVKIDGESYMGNYDFDGNIVAVYFEDEYQGTQIDGASKNIEALAKHMLYLLVNKSTKQKQNN